LPTIQLQRRPDWPRRHPIHTDAFLGELFRQTDREARNRRQMRFSSLV
jgi:hypothetical protein